MVDDDDIINEHENVQIEMDNLYAELDVDITVNEVTRAIDQFENGEICRFRSNYQ